MTSLARILFFLSVSASLAGAYLAAQGLLVPILWDPNPLYPDASMLDAVRLIGATLLAFGVASAYTIHALRVPLHPEAVSPTNRVVTLVRRIIYGLSLSLLYWVAVIEGPVHEVSPAVSRALAFLDLPLALFGRILPQAFRPIDVLLTGLRSGTYFCFGIPSSLVWAHLLASLPLYLLMFYSPAILRRAALILQRHVATEANRAAGALALHAVIAGLFLSVNAWSLSAHPRLQVAGPVLYRAALAFLFAAATALAITVLTRGGRGTPQPRRE